MFIIPSLYDQVSVSVSSLRINSEQIITDLQKLVRPELELVTGPPHTKLLGLWKFLFSLFMTISLNMPNLVRIG